MELIFKISVNRNGKKLTISFKNAKSLTVNRKSHHPLRPSLHGHSLGSSHIPSCGGTKESLPMGLPEAV